MTFEYDTFENNFDSYCSRVVERTCNYKKFRTITDAIFCATTGMYGEYFEFLLSDDCGFDEELGDVIWYVGLLRIALSRCYSDLYSDLRITFVPIIDVGSVEIFHGGLIHDRTDDVRKLMCTLSETLKKYFYHANNKFFPAPSCCTALAYMLLQKTNCIHKYSDIFMMNEKKLIERYPNRRGP